MKTLREKDHMNKLRRKTKRVRYLKDYRTGKVYKIQREAWLEKHPGYYKKWMELHPNYFREWQLKRKAHYRQYQKQWRKKNREKINVYMKKYRKKVRIKKT